MGLFDFFKPDWKHSDPRVRQKSIERVTETLVLAEILSTDEDSNVRQAVLESLDTIPKMQEVLRGKQVHRQMGKVGFWVPGRTRIAASFGGGGRSCRGGPGSSQGGPGLSLGVPSGRARVAKV